MLSTPWHMQPPLHHDLENYHELGLIHDLNLDWMSDFSITPVESHYQIQFHQEPLTAYCIDRTPTQALISIREYVIATHWETFAKTVGKAAEKSSQDVRNLLTLSTWKSGTRAFDSSKLPSQQFYSLSELKLVLQFSPFFSKNFSQWIPVRTTQDTLELEIQAGLHQHPHWKDPYLSPFLMDLHLVWTTAFLLKWVGPLKHHYDASTKRILFTRSAEIPISFPSADESS